VAAFEQNAYMLDLISYLEEHIIARVESKKEVKEAGAPDLNVVVAAVLRLRGAMGRSSDLLRAAAFLLARQTSPASARQLSFSAGALDSWEERVRFEGRRALRVTWRNHVTQMQHVPASNVPPAVATLPSIDTIREQRARICVSLNGAFLFVLNGTQGLVKLGTGQHNTVLGRVYAQNPRLYLHAGAFLAFGELPAAGGRREPVILLRSPWLPGTLLRVDPETLLLHRERIVLSGDGDGKEAADAKRKESKEQSQQQVEFRAPALTWALEWANGVDLDQPKGSYQSLKDISDSLKLRIEHEVRLPFAWLSSCSLIGFDIPDSDHELGR
jgi:hypothetical protein